MGVFGCGGGGGRVLVREFRSCRKIGPFLTQLGYKGIGGNFWSGTLGRKILGRKTLGRKTLGRKTLGRCPTKQDSRA